MRTRGNMFLDGIKSFQRGGASLPQCGKGKDLRRVRDKYSSRRSDSGEEKKVAVKFFREGLASAKEGRREEDSIRGIGKLTLSLGRRKGIMSRISL